MTVSMKAVSTLLAVTAVAALLGACATTPAPMADATPPATPLDRYPLTAQNMVKPIHLRINPQGLSPNQRTALDQVAQQASWVNGEPVSVEIITAGDPAAVAAGRAIGDYLVGHDVAVANIAQSSAEGQPSDIVTVNMVYYRARTYACGGDWGNLAATASNATYDNFGCAVNSNLAAQIADPRDLDQPRTATSADAGRKSVILDKYRKGEVTSAQKDDGAKGTISDAIK